MGARVSKRQGQQRLCLFSFGLKAVGFPVSFQLSFFIPPADGFALVVLALAPGQGQGHLGLALLEVDFKRDQRQAFFIDLADQALDFIFMQQQLAGALRVVVAVGGKRVGADMHLMDEDFPLVVDLGVSIFQVDPAEPQRFDFGAAQGQAGFIFVLDKIIEAGLFVDRYDFDVLVFFHLQAAK